MQARRAALSVLSMAVFPTTFLALVHCGSPSEGVTKVEAAPVADGAAGDAAKPDVADAAVTPDGGRSLASMTQARSIFAAVSGKDGLIRTFGGLGPLSLIDAMETYDPTSNTWTKGADASSVRRYGHAATEDASGNVYVIGGTVDGKSPIGTVEIFSPATGAFAAIADLPTPRLGLGAATGKDGKIYAIGGRDDAGGASSVVEVYAAATKTWSAGPSLPTRRLALVAVTGADGKIYAIGGRDSDDVALGTVEVLDTETGTWSPAPSLNAPRFWLGATRGSDGNIYALGGASASGFLDRAEVLRPGGATWNALPAMPEPRAWLSAGASADGRVFAIGGGTPGAEGIPIFQPPPVRTMVGFDTKSGTWTR